MASFNLVHGGGGNYTGFLTRSIVFSGALIAFLAGKENHVLISAGMSAKTLTEDTLATGLTLAAIIVPNWISFENHTVRTSHLSSDTTPKRQC